MTATDFDVIKHFLNIPTLEEISSPYNPKIILETIERFEESGDGNIQEKQLVLEFKIMILLELNRKEEAEALLSKIKVKGRRLKILEILVKDQLKIRTFENELKQFPCFPRLHKRLIILLYENGQFNDAIESLVEYLDVFQQDVEAILLLIDLYLRKGMFQQARFMQGELLLIKPDNYHEILKYADLCFALADYSNAFHYYLKSVDLVGDSLQGWYGIHECAKILKDTEFLEISKERISTLETGPSNLIVKEYLEE
jgi:tetratricopeptide (TPR) repeat protein